MHYALIRSPRKGTRPHSTPMAPIEHSKGSAGEGTEEENSPAERGDHAEGKGWDVALEVEVDDEGERFLGEGCCGFDTRTS